MIGKLNAKGRNKYEAHIRLHRGVTNSEAWKTLSCEATRLLLLIWARHNGTNNGSIAYSHRQARANLRVGFRKVKAAFEELQEKGFLVCRSKGSFDYKVAAGEGRASEWEITEEPCDGERAKKSYKKWAEKQNTVTTSVPAGNHFGSRSRKISHKDTPSGNHVGSRYGPSATPSGNHVGSTCNIPRGGDILLRPERVQPARIKPYLDKLKVDGFTPDVALAHLKADYREAAVA